MYANILSLKALKKLEDEFGYVPTPPTPVPQIGVPYAVTHCDDYPHIALNSWKKRICLCEAQNWRCCYCGVRVYLRRKHNVHISDDTFGTVDHIIPRARGGLAIWSNEVIACTLCNNGRNVIDAMVYFEAVQKMGRHGAFRWGVLHMSMQAKTENARKRQERHRPRLINAVNM